MSSEQNDITYEIIATSEITNVRFCSFVENGCYTCNHWHRAVEIIYVLKGSYTIVVNTKSYSVAAGNCIVIDANVIHSVKSIEPSSYILLQIPLDFIERYIPNVYQLSFSFVDNEAEYNPKLQRKVKVFKHLLRKMKELDDNRREGFWLYFNQLLFKLLCQLHCNFCDKVYQFSEGQKTKEIVRLNKILAYIMQNYTQTISLEEIAKIAGFEAKYFCRFFKRHMGITFKEYQNELRLSYIYRDLLETNDSIALILERHGFTNYKLFRRMFKNHFNDTPMEMRKKLNTSAK